MEMEHAAGRCAVVVARAAAARGVAVPLPHPVREALRRNGIVLFPLVLIVAVLDGVWVLGEIGIPAARTAARWLDAIVPCSRSSTRPACARVSSAASTSTTSTSTWTR